MTDQAQAILTNDTSVAEKIRSLARTGLSRSAIATLLGKSYQQVRNVLVDDERRQKFQQTPTTPGLSESSATPFALDRAPRFERIDVAPDGALRLPEALKAALGVGSGGYLVAQIDEDGSVRLVNGPESFRRVSERLRSLVGPDRLMSEELIADRRAEAAAENERG